MVVLGSLPIGVPGPTLRGAIEGPGVRSLGVAATALRVFALVLHLADRRARSTRTPDQLTWRHGAASGLARALALGVSRSGGTVAAGLLLGRPAARGGRPPAADGHTPA